MVGLITTHFLAFLSRPLHFLDGDGDNLNFTRRAELVAASPFIVEIKELDISEASPQVVNLENFAEVVIIWMFSLRGFAYIFLWVRVLCVGSVPLTYDHRREAFSG